MPRRALVTGASGFVGRHFTQRLYEDGWHVYGFDIDPGGVQEPYLWQQDARDYFRTASARFDLVVHCAAVVGGRATIEGAPLSVAVDLAIDAEMFGWALRTRPGKVVYFSSSAVYPAYLQTDDRHGRLHEELVNAAAERLLGVPDLTYGWAKLSGEILARHAREAGLDVLVLRPFSGYGEDQSLDYPFPSFVDRAKRRADPFDVWGDGEQVRDWIHVDDVVGAVMACLDEDLPGPVNLGTGKGTSMLELARMVCAQAGYRPEFRTHPDKPAGVAYRVCDPTRMLGFYEPRVSLKEGIRRALA